MAAHFFLPPVRPEAQALPVARRLAETDLGWATELLWQAAATHPAVQYVCGAATPGPAQQWLLGQLLALALRHGGAYTNGSGTALALWLGPEQPALPWRWQLRQLAAPWHLGWAGSQRLRHLLRTAAWLRHQSLTGPHHLLLAVAVHPQVRGRGEGRRLLGATLALRQATPLPCYFSAQVPGQLAFYQGQGFGLAGHCAVGAGPAGALSNWGLLRPAGAL